MSKERLSKLQKWILLECYKYEESKYSMWRYYILKYFGLSKYSRIGRNKAEVSITRSLKNLFKKGYIDLAIGYRGGWYILEDTKEGLLCNYKELKRLENGGKPAKFGDSICDIEYMKNLIANREKVTKERIFTPSIMGENIKGLKLTDEGIKLVKKLNVKN